MTLVSCVGGEGNLLAETPDAVPPARAAAAHPHERGAREARRAATLADFPVRRRCPMLFDAVRRTRATLSSAALERRCCAPRRSAAVDDGASILVLSDRGVDRDARAPIPSLLASQRGASRARRATGKRMRVGLVVETGEAREVADVALLIGYGAGAVNPYLAFEAIAAALERSRRTSRATSVEELRARARQGPAQGHEQDGHLAPVELPRRADLRGARHLGKAVDRRVLHRARRRASAASASARSRARRCCGTRPASSADVDATSDEDALDVGGVYAWRVGGERHLWTPEDGRQPAEGGAPRGRDARTRSTRGSSTTRATRRFTLRGCWTSRRRGRAGAARGGRAGARRSCAASRPAR